MKKVLLLLLILVPYVAYSQKYESKLAADVSAGVVFPSHKFLWGRNLAGKPVNSTVSAHLKYGIQLGPDTELGRKYPNTYQGIGVSYHSFFNKKELGSPFGIYVFQHSRIADLAPNLSLDYEWNFGIACNWVKYDKDINPYNRVIGTKVSAYINLGFMVNWSFAPEWNLTAGVDFSHFSNGNTTYPNYGLNDMTFRTGVIRSFGTDTPEPPKVKSDFTRHVTYDLILYGAWRKKLIGIGIKDYVMDENFAVAGLNFNPLYNVCKYFRTGLSLDMVYDRSANIQHHITNINETALEYESPPFMEQFAVGVSARAELVMPIFSVNVGFGGNIIAKGEDKNLMYGLLALKTSISKNLYIHVGCTLYSLQRPRCLMLGLGYRFNNKN